MQLMSPPEEQFDLKILLQFCEVDTAVHHCKQRMQE